LALSQKNTLGERRDTWDWEFWGTWDWDGDWEWDSTWDWDWDWDWALCALFVALGSLELGEGMEGMEGMEEGMGEGMECVEGMEGMECVEGTGMEGMECVEGMESVEGMGMEDMEGEGMEGECVGCVGMDCLHRQRASR
jgi:hypothetical protein